ncbi:hypothetical protein TCAL_08453 [Tigriopus californicus]|uniref:ER membrane protein complex subunit 2 n=1 Tax=Tigriopus californicus TaxID=6832 RepID=A0A553P245_TIGCA|nr:ER membrane protein complex subunit 2-like [Tigriopus californicus]TRY71767.1 hypothetical protein TCAL_08453 [Tigriopus californicus]|eukprot:TCALIF_08453-PA protein Name:"Similar to emc2 ER membrane protein complex subunit 2 (Xenopus tropicalis)" AED:0.06 eAED:0.06 QI:59/1/1/1/0.4/0.33/6/138/289
MNVQEGRELLRSWREDNVRRSMDVVDLWDSLLSQDPEALGDEKWMVLEQVAVAAMDVQRRDVVERCLKRLKAEFDLDSIRVRRLYGMRHEMMGDWESALKLYDTILEEDSANSSARKRKIAIHRAKGERPQAIGELSRYLNDFLCDTEAWMELCDLYLEERDYAKAAYCCEELILHNPNNHIYFQRYAEIKYTQGGMDNIEMAKTYYAKTLSLNPDNIRALYGILLASFQLASSNKMPAPKKQEFMKMVMWSSKQIQKRYQTKNAPIDPSRFIQAFVSQPPNGQSGASS